MASAGSWAVCKSAPRSRQITTPAPHHSVFVQAGCCSCRPTNSVKALKGTYTDHDRQKSWFYGFQFFSRKQTPEKFKMRFSVLLNFQIYITDNSMQGSLDIPHGHTHRTQPAKVISMFLVTAASSMSVKLLWQPVE